MGISEAASSAAYKIAERAQYESVSQPGPARSARTGTVLGSDHIWEMATDVWN